MHAVAAMVDRLKTVPGLSVTEGKSEWHTTMQKGASLVFDVTIPKGVLEWFASAKNNGREVWSDWTEHYATAGESRIQLEEEMARDVEDFIRRVLCSKVTASVSPDGSATLLWERPDGQKHVTLFENGA